MKTQPLNPNLKAPRPEADTHQAMNGKTKPAVASSLNVGSWVVISPLIWVIIIVISPLTWVIIIVISPLIWDINIATLLIYTNSTYRYP